MARIVKGDLPIEMLLRNAKTHPQLTFLRADVGDANFTDLFLVKLRGRIACI